MLQPVSFPLAQPELALDLHGGLLRRTVHPSGLRILTENMPGARSASIGFWVAIGSRDEQSERADAPGSLGSTHFLEHLLFKGTPSLGAYDIARAFDKMGADHNALTAKEHTAYYAKVRDANIAEATSLLAQMVTDSIIDEREFELERGVILEELAMAADDLADVAGEKFFETVLAGHPLGRPIGGNPQTILTAQRDAVMRHYQETYLPSTLIVTAAGAVDHDQFVQTVTDALNSAQAKRWSLNASKAPVARRNQGQTALELKEKTSEINVIVTQKPSEQVHIMLGSQGLQAGHDKRFAFGVMNSVLGGGMSSRLFQEIREKRGFAYATYSFGASYSDAGLFGMYAASKPEKARDVAKLMQDELAKIAADGISEEEFERILGQIAGSSALVLEDSDTRMSRLARSELGTGEFYDLDVSLKRFEEVTADEVREAAQMMLSNPAHLVAVGDISPEQLLDV
ncbi:MAG TPA: pitrilysin family protein [Microbacteriaceae bacterium]|nr:pitrilysin family protein [Microbacteriaceae bacterium]